MEKRYFDLTDIEVEERDGGKTPRISGYAALFNSYSEDLGGFREIIEPGAFSDSLASDDIRAFWAHDDSKILGRTKNDTLRLEENTKGLKVTIAPDMETSFGRDAYQAIKRGDVDQMSFGFSVLPDGDKWAEDPKRGMVRTLTSVRLYEVSPVAFPAYTGTSIQARDLGDLPEVPELGGMDPGDSVNSRADSLEGTAKRNRIIKLKTTYRGGNKTMNIVLEKKRRLAEIRKLAEELNSRETFGENEQREFDSLMAEADTIQDFISRNERVSGLPQEPTNETRTAPAVLKIPRGDTEERAMAHFVRTGDDGGLREWRASNATDMNETTAADGGNIVPTGHYNQIVARRDETRLSSVLGVRSIPGTGLTVNVPLDGEDDGEFISTAESVQYDLDAPALGTVAMTLVKYTKRVRITEELMQDKDSDLLGFLADFVGRGMAKTHNDLLVTAVESGANIATTASATVLAAGELETAVYGSNIAYYLDDLNSVAWIMQPPTYAKVINLAASTFRVYSPQTLGSGPQPRPDILGYPVYFSNKVEAYGTTAYKFALFGNFNFVGMRELPQFTVLRDPFTRASYGEIELLYSFRTVYKVLQTEAVGYVDHA